MDSAASVANNITLIRVLASITICTVVCILRCCQLNHQYYKATLNSLYAINSVKRGPLCHPAKVYNRPHCNDKQLTFGVYCPLMG